MLPSRRPEANSHVHTESLASTTQTTIVLKDAFHLRNLRPVLSPRSVPQWPIPAMRLEHVLQPKLNLPGRFRSQNSSERCRSVDVAFRQFEVRVIKKLETSTGAWSKRLAYRWLCPPAATQAAGSRFHLTAFLKTPRIQLTAMIAAYWLFTGQVAILKPHFRILAKPCNLSDVKATMRITMASPQGNS
jgi:hypothetical protein